MWWTSSITLHVIYFYFFISLFLAVMRPVQSLWARPGQARHIHYIHRGTDLSSEPDRLFSRFSLFFSGNMTSTTRSLIITLLESLEPPVHLPATQVFLSLAASSRPRCLPCGVWWIHLSWRKRKREESSHLRSVRVREE